MDDRFAASERPIPELEWGMPVEVMKDFDTVLMFGKLAAAGQNGLTIRRISSELCFPILDAESVLIIRCYDIQMAPVILRAAVIRSSGMECMVGKVEWIPYQTQRRNVRYPLCPPAMVSIQDAAAQDQLRPCQLLNISAGGACIVSECNYVMGQTLRLQIGTAKTEGGGPYPCKVIRTTPRRGGCFEYGLSFEKLSEEQLRYLAEILENWFHMRPDLPEESDPFFLEGKPPFARAKDETL